MTNNALVINDEDRQIAWLAALAIVVHILESGIPSPLPGIKPGMANIVTLLVLVRFGWHAAAWVSGLRVVAGSLLIGTFMSPGFFLSLAGAFASITVLGMLWLLPHRLFSLYAYSVAAAVSHICAQLFTAWLLFIPHAMILRLLPVLIVAGIVFGLINAIIANLINNRIGGI